MDNVGRRERPPAFVDQDSDMPPLKVTASIFALVIWFAGVDGPRAAADEEPGSDVVVLWPEGAPGAHGDGDPDVPTITVRALSPESANGCAVVICPGGGYGGLAKQHEGYDIAEWLNSFGVAGFVLRYRHAPQYRHPAPLLDVQRAIRTVRARAKEWHVDPNRIGVMGFSAGGHLASTAGTHFDSGRTSADDAIDRVSCRPDFMILAYPVISLTSDYTHRGSRRNLLGEDPDPALVKSLSNELQVTAETSPTFLFHTNADRAVPPENSVLFYLALRKAGVAAEMHLYQEGRHGLGLAPQQAAVASWPDRCREWLQVQGMLKAE
jgi:acetyl esterase/lipase